MTSLSATQFALFFLCTALLCPLTGIGQPIDLLEDAIEQPKATSWSKGFTIPPDRDTIIVLPGWTAVHLPAGAFVTQKGHAVEGRLDLNVRETIGPLPANYWDSTAVSSQIRVKAQEHSGTFEIRAFYLGEELKLQKEKGLNLYLNTHHGGDFMLYREQKQHPSKWRFVHQEHSELPGTSTTGRPLRWDTIESPATKILTRCPLQITDLNGESAPEWIYQAPWLSLELSRPQFSCFLDEKAIGKAKGFYEDGALFSLDSNRLIVYRNDSVLVLDYTGAFRFGLPISGREKGRFETNGQLIIEEDRKASIRIVDTDGKTVLQRIGAQNLQYLSEHHLYWYTNFATTDSTHYYLDVVDEAGNRMASIPCRKHPKKQQFYFQELKKGKGVAPFWVSPNQQWVATITGEGIKVYSADGSLQATTPNNPLFQNAKFSNYRDHLILTDTLDRLWVWNWKAQQLMCQPWSTNFASADTYASHPALPLLAYSDSKQKQLKFWNWETDKADSVFAGFNTTYLAYGNTFNYLYHYGYSGRLQVLQDSGEEVALLTNESPNFVFAVPDASGGLLTAYTRESIWFADHRGKRIQTFDFSGANGVRISPISSHRMGISPMGWMIGVDSKDHSLKFQCVEPNFSFRFSLDAQGPTDHYWVKSKKTVNEDGSLRYHLGDLQLLKVYADSSIWAVGASGELYHGYLSEARYQPNEYQITLQSLHQEFVGRTLLDAPTHKRLSAFQNSLFDTEWGEYLFTHRKYFPPLHFRTIALNQTGGYRWSVRYFRARTRKERENEKGEREGKRSTNQ